MVRIQVSAWLREQTLPVFADAVLQLFLTGWMAEIRGRSSDIVDISFEILLLCDCFRFCEKGFVASDLHDPPLMKSKCAEAAAAETSPVADQAETDLGYGGNSALLFVGRMISPRVWKRIDVIHLRDRERFRRRILHDKQMFRVGFRQLFPCKGICILILDVEALCIIPSVSCKLFIRREKLCVQNSFPVSDFYDSPRNVSDLLHRNTSLECFRDLDYRPLSHPV